MRRHPLLPAAYPPRLLARPASLFGSADAVGYVFNISDSGGPPGHFFQPSLLAAAAAALVNGTTISLEDTDPDSAAYATQLPVALAQGLVTIEQIRVREMQMSG